MTRGVLFDFDGTLIDTWRLYLEAFRRSLAPHFNRLLSDAEILDYQPSAERRLLRRVIEEADFPRYYASFLKHYGALHETHGDGLYPGVVDLLGGLRAGGYRLGVVTGKSRAAWDVTFPKSGLTPFDVVVADDDVAHPKPHPEGVLTALRALQLAPAEVLYVGDSLLDCAAARAAGVRFGAALWSKTEEEQEAFRAAAGRLGAADYFDSPAAMARRIGTDFYCGATHG